MWEKSGIQNNSNNKISGESRDNGNEVWSENKTVGEQYLHVNRGLDLCLMVLLHVHLTVFNCSLYSSSVRVCCPNPIMSLGTRQQGLNFLSCIKLTL